MRIVIAGGGIGGLSAAIALRRSGFEVVVLERDPAPQEAGAAITLWSNALMAARALGVDDQIRAAGDEVHTGEIRSWRGSVLMRTPVGDIGRRLGAPSVCLGRRKLLGILRDALPQESIRYGARVTGFREEPGGVTASVEGGDDMQGDVLIGSDGISSSVRSQLLGDEKPRYAGHLCFRAIVDGRPSELPLGFSFESWGVGDSFGMVPMRGDRLYWFANVSAPLGTRFDDAKATLLSRYRSWHDPVTTLIEATPSASILCNEVFDRDPVGAWGRGRITLLGDAAHPATPDLGQGGCLAMEDAVVLADCLRATEDPEAALSEYESLRLPRANRLTKKSRWFGWIGHQNSQFLCRLRDLSVRLTPGFLTTRDFLRLVDYDAGRARMGM
jgi:2-polyprenyl-6-methoxyphenol hydroxylase-like FAD-dependent oxidoreductase